MRRRTKVLVWVVGLSLLLVTVQSLVDLVLKAPEMALSTHVVTSNKADPPGIKQSLLLALAGDSREGVSKVVWPERKPFVGEQVDVIPTDVGVRLLLPEGTVPDGAFEANEPEATYFWSRAGEALIKVSVQNGRVLWKSVCPGTWGVSEGPRDKLFLHSVDTRPVWQFRKRSDTLQETIYSPGRGVRAMAFSEDGKITYWADIRERAVYEVNLPQRKVARTFQMEIGAPLSLALTPDGKKLYVGTNAILFENPNTASEIRRGVVEVIDLEAGALRLPLVVKSAPVVSITVSPSGDKAYAVTASLSEGNLHVIDTTNDELLTGREGIYLATGLRGVVLSSDPRYGYVSGADLLVRYPEETPGRLEGPFVALVDLESYEVLARTPVARADRLTASENGKHLYVTGGWTDTIDTINTATLFEMAGLVPPWESTTETETQPSTSEAKAEAS